MDIPSAKDDDMPIDFQERRTEAMLCPDEVRRLYFDEGLSQKQIAERAGWRTAHPVRRIFNEQGWIPRVQRGGVSPRHFESAEERKLARIEHKRKTALRIQELRENLWGTKCRLCGVSKDEKLLHIHRKDGKRHPEEALRRLRVLKSLEPNEFAPLCGTCHSGTHWLMNKGMTWKDIESYNEKFNKSLQKPKEPLELPDDRVKSSERYLELTNEKNRSPKELRREIFGENCRFCGIHSDDMRVVIHRKDLRPHSKSLLRSRKYLRTLNPDGWATLCPICHRYTHWACNNLGME
jgi:transposase